mgnify:CR=1
MYRLSSVVNVEELQGRLDFIPSYLPIKLRGSQYFIRYQATYPSRIYPPPIGGLLNYVFLVDTCRYNIC